MHSTIYNSMSYVIFPGPRLMMRQDMMIRGKDTQVNDQESSYWRVGPNSIGIDSLVLVGLENVSKGSWQPRIGFLSHREINSSSTPFVI